MVLQILVFVSGLSVMAVEMTGLRLLAPYFGTSLLVTTILIGSMMCFLSVGYALGGRIGDRHPSLQRLSSVTLAASVAVLLLPLLSRPILQAATAAIKPLLQQGNLEGGAVTVAMVVGGLLATLALFAVPVTLMGMVSPWAVRLAVSDIEQSGRAAGRLYALSTVGSILGSFAPAIVLIPAFGVRQTFLLIGGLLGLVSAIGMLRKAGAAVPVAALAIALTPEGIVRPMDGLVEESESIYHFIQVVIEPYGPCDEAYHLYLNEGVGVHSVKCLDPEIEVRGIWHYMAAAPLFSPEPEAVEDVLIIGLAGGTIARKMAAAFPGVQVDGVEIDGDVVDVGRRYFDNGMDGLTAYTMDGRIFLEHTDQTYDVILMDAYRQPYIPFHLTTLEFWQRVDEHLNDDGVVAINVATPFASSRSLAGMLQRTMREVFPSVHLLDATRANDILYATKSQTRALAAADALDARPDLDSLDSIRKRFRTGMMGDVEGWETAQILTDDKAPVELAWEMMQLDFLEG